MVSSTTALLNLTAADVMSASVVAIPEEMSLRGAAYLLSQAAVTGAPVVNAQGRCVGVISATDFVQWAGRIPGCMQAQPSTAYRSPWQLVNTEELPGDCVANYMTRNVVTALPATPLGHLARTMMDAHIHRVIIVDKHGNPVGIVSSTDMLAAMARADQARTTAAANAAPASSRP